jgi:hypothetical protein
MSGLRAIEHPEGSLWSRLVCSRCNYRLERPGSPLPADLDRGCGLCGSPLRAVTTYKLAVLTTPREGRRRVAEVRRDDGDR